MNTQTVFPEIVRLHNLLPDNEATNCYRPLGNPRRLADEGLTLLTAFDSRHALAATPDATLSVDADTGDLVPLHPEAAQCACRLADDKVLTFAAGGPVLLSREADDEPLRGVPTDAMYGPVTLTAVAAAPVGVDIDAMTLSRQYNPGDPLTTADRDAVLAQANAMYAYAANLAQREGVFVQPFLARAVVEDADGNVMHRGPVQLVMPPEGIPFDSGLTLTMDSHSSTALTHLDVATFRLRVIVHPYVSQLLAERARRLRVEVSPAFHPWVKNAADGAGSATVVRRGTSDIGLQIVLPGTANSLSAHDSGRSQRLVADCLAAFEATCAVLRRLDAPFDRGADVVFDAFGLGTVAEQAALLTRKQAVDPTTARLNAPHTFTARTATATPSAVAYGNVARLPYAGYSPADYARAVDNDIGDWEAVTVTTYADGSRGVRHSRYTGHRPATLGALVWFPDAEARSVDITMRGTTAHRRWHIDLTPDATSTAAYGLTADLSERRPEEVTDEWPDDVATELPPARPMPSTVLIADTRDPLNIKATVDCPAEVKALVPARSTQGAWDFGRNRFLCFTPESIFLLNASADCRTVSSARMAGIGVDAAGSVAETDTAAVFAAGRNGIIYRINGTTVAEACRLPELTDRVGFDASTGHIVAGATSGQGPLFHIDARSGSLVATSTMINPFDTLLAVGYRLLTDTQTGLYDVSARGRDAEGTAVWLRGVTPATCLRGKRGVCRLRCDIDSECFDGAVKLTRRSTSARTAPAMSLTLKGRIAAPFSVPVLSRPVDGLEVEVSGIVSADTRIGLPSLTFRKP